MLIFDYGKDRVNLPNLIPPVYYPRNLHLSFKAVNPDSPFLLHELAFFVSTNLLILLFIENGYVNITIFFV